MAKNPDPNSRRLRIVYVEPADVLALFSLGNLEEGTYVGLPVIEGLPEDAEVVSIHDDWRRRALCLVIRHESFEHVLDGDMMPEHNNGYVAITVRMIGKKGKTDGEEEDGEEE